MAAPASSTSPLLATSIKSTTSRMSFWTRRSKERSRLGQLCGADVIHLLLNLNRFGQTQPTTHHLVCTSWRFETQKFGQTFTEPASPRMVE
ncbi:hypothetical protein ACFXTI_014840 [Malus domestica]